MVTAEYNNFDVDIPESLIASGQHQEQWSLFEPNQGVDSSEIVGRSARVRKIEVRCMGTYLPQTFGYQVEPSGIAQGKAIIRIILYLDKQPGEVPDNDLLSSGRHDILAFRDLDQTGRYQILYDDFMVLKMGKNIFMGSMYDGTPSITGSITGTYNLGGILSEGAIWSKTPEHHILTRGKWQGRTEQDGTGTVGGTWATTGDIDGFLAGEVSMPITLGSVRGNGEAGGALTAPAGVGTWEGVWTTGLTGMSIITQDIVDPFPGPDLDDIAVHGTITGTAVPDAADPVTIGGLNFDNTFVLDDEDPIDSTVAEVQSDLGAILPRINLDAPFGDGLFGDVRLNGVELQIPTKWTGDTQFKNIYVDTDFQWQKDFEQDRITQNDIRLLIITEAPRGWDDMEPVLSFWFNSRIRYSDK